VTVALDLGAYSDIADYPGLIDKVRLWLDRGDELNPYLPTFIMLAESYLNRTLRTPEMEAYTSVPVVGGLARLPLDCLEVRGISVGERPLQATSPANLARDYRGLAGAPLSYAIRGRDLLLAPTSDDALDLTYCPHAQRPGELAARRPPGHLPLRLTGRGIRIHRRS
jgi:hypothetical protein